MDKANPSQEKAATWASAKGFLVGLTVLCVAGAAVWFGYVQFFTKGLDHLPAKVCDGTVERDTVKQVLPSARSAEEGSKRQSSGEDLTFYCHVDTSGDSSLWGEARIRPLSRADWLESYQESGDGSRLSRASVDGIEALARSDDKYAAVYVPCVPRSVDSADASEDYGVVTRVYAEGDTEATGEALEQRLTDIAYRLSEHTYELAECQNSLAFPEELPRYENG